MRISRRDMTMTRKPDFFIVGAPRCGTTAMYEYLRQHPEIFMPERKEPHFFGSDLTVTPKFVYYTRDIQEYCNLFATARNEKRIGEASTLYLKSRRAPAEIKKFSPAAKVIIMLRNPVDVIYSLHSHVVYIGEEEIKDFEGALEAERDRTLGLRIPKGNGLLDSLLYREVVKFSQQVERYFQIFGQDNVHIIIYDDLRDDTLGAYKGTLRFLGISSDFQPELGIIYENRRARSKVLQYMWANRPTTVQRYLMDCTPPWLSQGVLKALKLVGSRPASRLPMNSELQGRLKAEFKPEVERLSQLLGRDLTHWCKE